LAIAFVIFNLMPNNPLSILFVIMVAGILILTMMPLLTC
jgi:hypothetical protein